MNTLNEIQKPFDDMTALEKETLQKKFRQFPNALHKTDFCRDSRLLVIAAAYTTSLTSTRRAVQLMVNAYKPDDIILTAMPRVAA